MFKKRDAVSKTNDEIPARFIKKDGVTRDTRAVGLSYLTEALTEPSKYVNSGNMLIPANEISESYLSKKINHQSSSAPNSTKGVRRIFAPSFLLRRKKTQNSNKNDYVNINGLDEEDITDIACYEDLVAEQQSINPVMLAQLDDSQINTIELDQYDRFYKNRLDFVLNNYRHPPPYPGDKTKIQIPTEDKTDSKAVADTPLIRQLLNDKQLNDNASMNNFWQASPKHNSCIKVSDQESLETNLITDKLVNRTKKLAAKSVSNENKVAASELYEKRKKYYMEGCQQLHRDNDMSYTVNQQDTLSEIIYPEKDYDLESESSFKGISMSASVPNLSNQKNQEQGFVKRFPLKQPRAHMEPGEMEALIAHYRKTSLDSFEPYGVSSAASESISLYSEDSPSYVPPSPYLSAEIPEWLQIYSKASPDLDELLKWEMFKYPKLDCYQTMLKRLYKKELEQVVLWFEEYRLSLQQQLEQRNNSVRYGTSNTVLKKTEV